MKLPQDRLRLAFFGTPELAETILRAVLEAGEDDVVRVVCQPDRPKGRGQKLEPPPVKLLAESKGLPVIQPEKMKDGAVTARLREDRIDLAVVAAYGRILPQDLLDAPRFGAWNVHASVLPRHRGASPIQASILSGDSETGVTLMQMSAGLDEGPMLLIAKTPIAPEENAGQLAERLASLGAKTLLEGIRKAKAEGLTPEPQDHARATYAGKITKEQGRLDLSKKASELDRQIRGLNPWPGTSIPLSSGEPLKILRAAPREGSGAPGTVLATAPEFLIATGEGALALLSVQPAGKKPMSASDWLRGGGRGVLAGAPGL